MARRVTTVGLAAGIALGTIAGACDLTGFGVGTTDGVCGSAVVDPQPAPRWVALPGQGELAVFVEGASTPIAGRMVEGPGGPAFRPAFPFSAGVRYRVEGEHCEASFAVAPSEAAAPSVVSVYPTSPEIPENVLRFYVYFSEPMAEGDVLEHIRLEHVETGEDLTGVFFDNIYELWSPDRKRITLLVDPGRVKTGLAANLAMGRAFEAGQTYRLHILGTWTSLSGRSLEAQFVKTYRAVTEDRTRVDPQRWCPTLPAVGTVEPLVVDFAEAVDHICVGRFLQVISPSDEPLAGAWTLDAHDHTASWTPTRPWSAPLEAHRLRINGRFEDIAGNNVSAAMDHRTGELSPGDEGRTYVRSLGASCDARP